MKTNTINQKKFCKKRVGKINLSKYLSKIISLKDIKLDSKKNKNIKINELIEAPPNNPTRLLAQKELEIKTLKLKCENYRKKIKNINFVIMCLKQMKILLQIFH